MSDKPSAFRFDFYERVRIASEDPSLAEIQGELGAILGRGEDEAHRAYAVYIYATEICWSVSEDDLEPTGEFDRRESFYDDSQPSLRISSDGEFLGFNPPRPSEE